MYTRAHTRAHTEQTIDTLVVDGAGSRGGAGRVGWMGCGVCVRVCMFVFPGPSAGGERARVRRSPFIRASAIYIRSGIVRGQGGGGWRRSWGGGECWCLCVTPGTPAPAPSLTLA